MLKLLKVFWWIIVCLIALPIAIAAQTLPSTPKWVDDLGGVNGQAIVSSSKIDAQNNLYITGIYTGTVDFDPSASGITNLTSIASSYDIFICKYDTNGALIWAKSVGGSGTDQANSLAIDSNGNVSIAGQYDSSTFDADPGSGTYNISTVGGIDMFLLTLDANGNFLWAKTIGGSGADYANRISIDKQGNRILAGQYQYSVTVGTQILNTNGNFGGVLAKYDASGNLLWVINLQNNDNGIRGEILDNNDDIIVTCGLTGTANFNPLGLAKNYTGSGVQFVGKYSAAGQLVWLKFITGTVVGNAANVDVDANNNIYWFGPSSTKLTFDTGASVSPSGVQDVMIAKFDTNGSFIWCEDIGGSGASILSNGLTISKDNFVYISGYFSGTVDFDPSTAVFPISYHGQRDLFLSKYDLDGKLQWALGAGNVSCNNTIGRSIAIDNNYNVLFSGAFCSTANFDISNCSSFNVTAQSPIRDSFIAKYVPDNSTAIGSNAITAPAITSYCTSGDPAVMTGSTATGGIGALIYQWQKSIDGANFINISGATIKDYDPPTINTTTYYRRTVNAGTCSTPSESNIVTVVVSAATITANSITAPGTTTFCLSGDPDIIAGSTPTGGTGTFSYQWQSSTDNASFTDIIGATQKDYDPPVLSINTYYRRTASSGTCAAPVNSNVVTITIQNTTGVSNVITAPAITAFCTSGDPAAIIGSSATMFTYQWQVSTDGNTFANIASAILKDYDPPVITAANYYRRVLLSSSCSTPLVSNVVSFSIQQPVSNNTITAPGATIFCQLGNPDAIMGSLPLGGTGIYGYQWQSSTDNLTFNDITGAVAKDYDPALLSSSIYYRRVVISAGVCAAPAPSNTISINIQPTITNNSIATPAINLFCASGDPAVITGTTPSGGNGVYVYQWQNSADNSLFADIPGATAKDYDPPVVNATAYYQRIVTSGTCSTPFISNAIAINVQQAIGNNILSAPAVISFCISGDPDPIGGSTPTGGNSIYSYQWQISVDNTTFADIAGATLKNYDPPTLTVTTYYRRVVNSGVCATPAISAAVTIYIQSSLSNNSIIAPAITAFCATGDPDVIKGSTAAGTSATYTYQWQSSNDNSTFTNISGATSVDYDPAVITQTTYYRRIVNSGSCIITLASNSVKIIINSLPIASAGLDTSICLGSTVTLNAAGGVSYQWSPAAGLSNTNTANPVATPTITTIYTVTVVNGSGCTATATVTVKVIPKPTVIGGADITLISGNAVQLNPSVTGSNLTYKWSPATYLSDPNILNPIASPTQDITYTLTVTSAKACFIATGNLFIKVYPKFIIPNAFSPNGDSVNDTWEIADLAIYPDCTVNVFNRAGNSVFKSTGYGKAWDGTYKGDPLPIGAYYYLIDLKEGSKPLSGSVIVFR